MRRDTKMSSQNSRNLEARRTRLAKVRIDYKFWSVQTQIYRALQFQPEGSGLLPLYNGVSSSQDLTFIA